jgi:hypothetical protein
LICPFAVPPNRLVFRRKTGLVAWSHH